MVKCKVKLTIRRLGGKTVVKIKSKNKTNKRMDNKNSVLLTR